MKCARCHRDRITSSVSAQDDAKPWTKDAVFEDARKRRHVHYPDEFTVTYTCSQGHKWTRRESHPCWCGWSQYLEENIASVRVFCEMSCWMGEDNFILINGKGYKGVRDVRLESSLMTEIDEILLENESPLCNLLRGE